MRVTNSPQTRKRHKKILKQAKGNSYSRSKRFRSAKETVERGMAFSFRDRRARKRDFRRLWITRINAAARQNGIKYAALIHGLKTAGIEVNRKMLAEMAINDKDGFAQLVEVARAA